jgi:phytoene desaturase
VGASPPLAPAIYSMLAHVDMNLGIWYPTAGFGGIVNTIEKLAKENGVKVILDSEVTKIDIQDGNASKVITANGVYDADVVVNTAEYPHCELELIDPKYNTYSEKYWNKRVVAPATFMIYLGLNKKINSFAHHNFYFNDDWDSYFDMVFGDNPGWPEDPSMYIAVPSKTDPNVAPEGGEVINILVLLAPGMEDTKALRDEYFEKVMDKVEEFVGETIRDAIVVKKVIAHQHFKDTYHAFKGTALGIANTLFQTAAFRPHHRSKKVKNLYYAGAYTHPGVGVPTTLISSQLVAEQIVEGITKGKL